VSDNQDFENENDFFEDEYVPTVNRWKLVGAGIAVVIVAGFAVGIWYAYDQGVKKGVQLAPPIIKADSSPVKKKPEDPGGMDIPHQDKKVFNLLTADKGSEKVEKLMKAPEEPVQEAAPVEITKDAEPALKKNEPENLMASAKTEEDKTVSAAPTEKAMKDTIAKTSEKIEETAKNAVPAVPATKEVIVTETKVEAPKVAPTEPTVVKAPPKAEPKPVVVAAVKGPAYRVQLGAFRSTDAAEKAWLDLQKKHNALLQGLPHKVQSVEIKGKGMFYRLQAGGYKNKVAASSLCGDLKKAKQDCLVAKN
jgi:cell division protein FtsN